MQKPWKEKYAPKSLDEMVISPKKKQMLEKVMTNVPNTLFYGAAGTGKSCFMNIFLNKWPGGSKTINASLNRGIETIKDIVLPAAQTAGYSLGGKNIICFEEADKLTNTAQSALKKVMDDTQKNASFFFLCNDRSGLIKEIRSRCTYKLNLQDPPPEGIFDYVSRILEAENITVQDSDDIRRVINDEYPCIRDIIDYIESHVFDSVLQIEPSLRTVSKKKSKLKTAEQRREADRLRAQKWHERQKADGKKQISCTISKEAHEILQAMQGSYSQNIDDLILNYGRRNN